MKHQPHRLVLYAFDLLHLDGQDLRQRELIHRRARLSQIITHAFAIRYSGHFEATALPHLGNRSLHFIFGLLSSCEH